MGTSTESFWSAASFEIEDVESMGDLISKLVEDVRRGEYLLDSDMHERVECLLHSPAYQQISRRFLPFIMECLGLSEEPTEAHWSSHPSLKLMELEMPAFIESSHL